MPLLNLQSPPPALQASLQRHFDNDESRRRAVLAPWASAGFNVIHAGGEWAWDPWQSFWRRQWAKDIRESREARFFTITQNIPYDGPGREPPGRVTPPISIFDPSLPFFPTPLTEVHTPMLSPWPDIVTHAEFWAFATQLCMGNPVSAKSEIERYMNRLRKAAHPVGWRRLVPGARSAVWRDIVWLTVMANQGIPP